jgi:hypothetical protein
MMTVMGFSAWFVLATAVMANGSELMKLLYVVVIAPVVEETLKTNEDARQGWRSHWMIIAIEMSEALISGNWPLALYKYAIHSAFWELRRYQVCMAYGFHILHNLLVYDRSAAMGQQMTGVAIPPRLFAALAVLLLSRVIWTTTFSVQDIWRDSVSTPFSEVIREETQRNFGMPKYGGKSKPRKQEGKRTAFKKKRTTKDHRAKTQNAAPVAIGARHQLYRAPKMRVSQKGDTITITSVDYISPLTAASGGNNAGDVLFTLPVNPFAVPTSRIAAMAPLYERYVPEGVFVKFKPTAPATSPGSIVGYVDNDPLDIPVSTAGTVNLQRACAHKGATECSIWQPMTFGLDLKKQGGQNHYYCDRQGVNRFNSCGRIVVLAATGLSAGQPLGNLELTWTFRFSIPANEVPSVPAASGTFTNFTSGVRANPMGSIGNVVQGGNLADIGVTLVSAISVNEMWITFPTVGAYLMLYWAAESTAVTGTWASVTGANLTCRFVNSSQQPAAQPSGTAFNTARFSAFLVNCTASGVGVANRYRLFYSGSSTNSTLGSQITIMTLGNDGSSLPTSEKTQEKAEMPRLTKSAALARAFGDYSPRMGVEKEDPRLPGLRNANNSLDTDEEYYTVPSSSSQPPAQQARELQAVTPIGMGLERPKLVKR